MRGKWVLAAAAVLALVVVGGFGGLSKAFAGVGRWMGTTSTVTKMCVYVDRTDGGDSYGDLSVLPKYNHKTCIVGKRGPAGSSSVITWNTTVATPSAPLAGRPGAQAHSVDLAKVGPFTVRGYCQGGDGVRAITDVLSSQDGSSFDWDDSMYAGDFNSGSDRQASNGAIGSPQNPDYTTETGNGEFSVSTGDQKTAFTGWAENGVYIQGPNGPACSFIGHLVIETPAAS
jgi:hypothetical protein